jgi:hypothetical protein
MLLAARGMALIATSLDMFRFDDGMDKITTPPMSYRPSIYFHFHFIHPESFHNLRIKYICNIQADARLRGLSS